MTVLPLARRSALWVFCWVTPDGRSDCFHSQTVSLLGLTSRMVRPDSLVMRVLLTSAPCAAPRTPDHRGGGAPDAGRGRGRARARRWTGNRGARTRRSALAAAPAR